MEVAQTAKVSFAMSLELGTGISPDELDKTTRELLIELADNSIGGICVPEGSAPDGAKGGVAATLGTLLVSLAPAVVPKLLDLLFAWVSRSPRRRRLRFEAQRGPERITIELKSGGVAPSEVAALLIAAITAESSLKVE